MRTDHVKTSNLYRTPVSTRYWRRLGCTCLCKKKLTVLSFMFLKRQVSRVWLIYRFGATMCKAIPISFKSNRECTVDFRYGERGTEQKGKCVKKHKRSSHFPLKQPSPRDQSEYLKVAMVSKRGIEWCLGALGDEALAFICSFLLFVCVHIFGNWGWCPGHASTSDWHIENVHLRRSSFHCTSPDWKN